MSLINKMLQDLDARGGAQSGQGNVPQMRPVTGSGQPPRAMLAAGAGLAVVLLAAGGWLGWRYLQRPAASGPVAAAAAPARSVAPAVTADAGAAGMAGTAGTASSAGVAGIAGTAPVVNAEGGAGLAAAANPPATVAAPASQPRARLLAVARPMPAPPAAVAADAGDNAATFTPRPSRRKADEKTSAELAAELKTARQKARQAKAEADRLAAVGAVNLGSSSSADSASRAGRAAGTGSAGGAGGNAATQRAAKAEARPARATEIAAQPGTGGVTVTSQQQGENAYRRGLAALQEGRVQEALSNMEQAVFLYPRHDTARQTLVGLLIENKRHDEAIRHLQFGLGLDPKQPQMAMILARLQIEKGGPAIETLQRSLPYAGGNGDYLAFLAGALQRAQRNREAAEQYQAALRLQPQNGVWWMGLGISLLADKRDAEAREAFARAKNSGNLSQELQAFVERKLQQLR
ncbi:hypothetical protein ASC94_00425 [Massilia sp. Root418]|uniref:tetratricopeptide repeat protein n=1 Tax=Massilia sp. Root418 TaxID=1736532 RepID=UPI0006F707B4|nr:tetratricopeptide repeat protein [Massilia sp. Root418]KQX01156.1 hypothetical protein ASC94_00425 [Massilia sp. Root418]